MKNSAFGKKQHMYKHEGTGDELFLQEEQNFKDKGKKYCYLKRTV